MDEITGTYSHNNRRKGRKILNQIWIGRIWADCVILLNNSVDNKITTRNLRIIKYRGSAHGSNEYPFLMNENGISVLPVTSLLLDHDVSKDHVSTGIKRLDNMLGGNGFFKGSSILISGSAGTGKSSLVAHLANNICKNGDKCLIFAFEESPKQIIRNMRSIGIDLEQWIEKGLLEIQATRPTLYGLETHLVTIHESVAEFKPDFVIFDPVSNLISVGNIDEVKSMLMRLIDYLKSKQITTLSTYLTLMGEMETGIGVSSLMDSWIDLKTVKQNGERNRTIDIVKTRGMAHSNQVREFQLTSNGIKLVDVYLGPSGMLIGSARVSQIAKERDEKLSRDHEILRLEREFEYKREGINSQIKVLEADWAMEKERYESIISKKKLIEDEIKKNREVMSTLRHSKLDK